jgi:hypothetical protein
MAILISISIEGGVSLSIANWWVGGHPVIYPADIVSVRCGCGGQCVGQSELRDVEFVFTMHRVAERR